MYRDVAVGDAVGVVVGLDVVDGVGIGVDVNRGIGIRNGAGGDDHEGVR